MDLSKLPIDIFIKIIRYLPFDKVIEICQIKEGINDELNPYCVKEKYSYIWKGLLLNTFGTLYDYPEILELLINKYEHYNYYVYTEFINFLDPIGQAMIYYKQHDINNFIKFNDKHKFYAMVLLGNTDMDKYDVINKKLYYNIMNEIKNDPLELVDELLFQVETKNIRVVEYILKNGGIRSVTALEIAFIDQDQPMIELMIRYGGDINQLNIGRIYKSVLGKLAVENYTRFCAAKNKQGLPIPDGSEKYWTDKGYIVYSFPELNNKKFICIDENIHLKIKYKNTIPYVCGKSNGS